MSRVMDAMARVIARGCDNPRQKQCDTKALAIVEQLLESNVNSNWLLQNLGFISKCHMEDVIEERAIIKLCGYVLCSNPLTVVMKQRYHISTRRNKVYDISRRKNFCSSLCYRASTYLLEQMLESPLWLRKEEDIPIFQIMHINLKSVQYVPGDEIDIVGTNLSQNIDDDNIGDNKEPTEHSTAKQTKENALTTVSSSKLENSIHLLGNMNAEENTKVEKISVNSDTQRLHESSSSELHINQESKDCDSQEYTSHENDNDGHNVQASIKLENLEAQNKYKNTHENDDRSIDNKNANVNVIYNNDNRNNTLRSRLDEISNSQDDTDKRLQFQSDEKSNDKSDSKLLLSQSDEVNNIHNNSKAVQLQLDKACNSSNTALPFVSSKERRKEGNANRTNKNKKYKQKESDSAQAQTNIYYNLAAHVERSVREWVTKNTLCLLLGDTDEKSQLLENLTQQDRYQQLCKKLNRLQLQDGKEDGVNSEENVLKPLPHLSVLQEEGKKMELKVRAFYEGRVTITPIEDSNKELESKDDPILPLTDAHAPNAVRRRIFLDKLSKILPDLLHALTANANTSSVAQDIYNNEMYSSIKLLISTFNLSATNIVFKTAEWTLVGLIIIKMLSLIDAQLQSLLISKQASMSMSMILMSYKLDTNYLDRLMEVINNVDASTSDNKEC